MASRSSGTPSAGNRASSKRRPRTGSGREGRSAGSGNTPDPRQSCPCGSGRRYKHCHGSGQSIRVTRPFEGLAGEADLIALRELVSAATAPLTLKDPAHADRDVLVVTVLPQLAPALVREDGQILLGLQLVASSDDVSADVGTALRAALAADPGQPVNPGPIGGAGSEGPRLQELIADEPLDVTVHEDYRFWLGKSSDDEPVEEALAGLMEQASASIIPSVRKPGNDAAYWCRPEGPKAHLRWVMTHPEELLLDALAVLGAASELDLGSGTKYAGAFRAHGLVAPVWDLPADVAAEEWWQPAEDFKARLTATMKTAPRLDEQARRFRSRILSGQVTLR